MLRLDFSHVITNPVVDAMKFRQWLAPARHQDGALAFPNQANPCKDKRHDLNRLFRACIFPAALGIFHLVD
jgi:hypothetical protein